MQLSRDVVDGLLPEPQTLSDGISYFSNQSLHVEMLERGSHLYWVTARRDEKSAPVAAAACTTRWTHDRVSEEGRVRQRKHESGRDEACTGEATRTAFRQSFDAIDALIKGDDADRAP